ncbi:MAG: OmpA family protein [Hyphomonadaceae bacterium]|nr:OmpA family protein [Hyphomonadaceae bacterium]
MSEKKKRRNRAMGAGIGAGAAVTAALFALALTGLGAGSGPNNPPWVRAIEEGLAKRGYDWLSISVSDRVATVAGQAPDVDSQRYGFEAAETELNRNHADSLAVIVDAINLEGGAAGVGAALRALGPAPELAACQQAFVDTLAGRTINFAPGRAELDGDNRRLLDTLSAVAIRCRAHRIEIGGHTDLTGSPSANLDLSTARAETVRGYLVSKGVKAEDISATGFGQTRPLENARTLDANARNRRIEFTVSAH